MTKKSLVGYIYEDWRKRFKWSDFDPPVKTKMLNLIDEDGDVFMLNNPYDVPNLRQKVRITIEEIK